MAEFGVHTHRNALGPGEVENAVDDGFGQGPFVIILQQDGVVGPGHQRLLDGCEKALSPFDIHVPVDFLVHPQQMLTPAHDAGLDGGRTVLDSGNGVTLNARVVKLLGQVLPVFVFSHQTGQGHRAAQSAQVEGHVGCAARATLPTGRANHRNRRFRTDALDPAEQVLIDHQVPHDHDPNLRCAVQGGQDAFPGIPGPCRGRVRALAHARRAEMARSMRRMASFSWASEAA